MKILIRSDQQCESITETLIDSVRVGSFRHLTNSVSADQKNCMRYSDEELLGRVPGLLLTLGSIYITLQLLACFMVTEPAVDRELVPQVSSAASCSQHWAGLTASRNS